MDGYRTYANREAKLEGLAVVLNELWVSFEGGSPCLDRLSLADFKAGSARSRLRPSSTSGAASSVRFVDRIWRCWLFTSLR